MKFNNLLSIILSVIFLIITTNLLAQDIPLLINYQGNLTDAAGQKINKPDVGMTFSIWSDKTSTDNSLKLWEEEHYPVAVTNGLFSVVLGEKTALSPDIFSSQNRYIEIVIGGEKLTPRQQICSVPYTLRAAMADNVKDGAITHLKQTIKTYSALDNHAKQHTGTGQTIISEFNFTDVPAGDIYVTLTCFAGLNVNSNSTGTVGLVIQPDNLVINVPTHDLVSERFTQLTLHGRLQNFSGGQLSVRLIASGETAQTSFFFGVEGDSRFGRSVTVIAGL